MNEGCNS
jgi:hypothetical protein